MKKFGFTLAEILVTMGIIGVVAAMTAPVLMTNVKNQSYATKLRTTVGDLENAFSMAIPAEKAEDLFGTSLWSFDKVDSGNNRDTFTENLGAYLKFNTIAGDSSSFYPDNNRLRLLNDNGTPGANTTPDPTQMIPFRLKNGAVMFYKFEENSTTAKVCIDVNGLDEPNITGRDYFTFDLSEDGTLNPDGNFTRRLVNNNYNFDY